MTDSLDVFLAPEQIAGQLQVATGTVHRWLRTGKLKGVRVSRKWRISQRDFEEYLRQRDPGKPIEEPVIRNGRLNYRLSPNGDLLWFEVK